MAKERPHRWLLAGLTFLVVAAAQIWLVSGGRWVHWDGGTSKYSELAAAFLHGQVSLLVKPLPELLALPNPYEPQACAPYRVVDACLFNGKYYYYWGPAPALIVAGVSWMMGISSPTMSDGYLAVGFLLGTTLMVMEFLRQLKVRPGVAAAATVSLGLGMPMLMMASDGKVYQAAIAAGEFFLLGGILAIWVGISMRRKWMLLMGGICLGLSEGSRVSLGPAIAGVATIAMVWIGRDYGAGRRRAAVWAAAALALPLLAEGAMLGAYNDARFGNPFEFGIRYELTGRDQRLMSASQFMTTSNIAPNVMCYLFLPPEMVKSFPYVSVTWGKGWLSRGIGSPAKYWCDPLAGLIYAQPFLGLAALGLRARAGRGWLAAILGIGAVGAVIPLLLLDNASTRFVLDVAPSVTLLAAMGFERGLERLEDRPWRRRMVAAAVWVVVAYQSVIGLSLAIGNTAPLMLAMRGIFPDVRW